MDILWEDVAKLLLAIALGGLVGAEREYRAKAAGLRTMILICLGCALVTVVSGKLLAPGDTTRIVANILTGIGFLGAGVIFKDHNRVSGITTAATIWVSASLGIAVGLGYFLLATVTTGFILAILVAFMFMERVIDRTNESHTYVITFQAGADHLAQIENVFRECDLRAERPEKRYANGLLTLICEADGKPANHAAAAQKITAFPFVMSVEA
jgi:putative Mg2+ transporter-C (MgtC) family protein